MDVLQELAAIRADMAAAPALSCPSLDEVHPNCRDSAENLLHYLALRRHDLRPLQVRLGALGLSSLGRAESHALASVDAVLGQSCRMIVDWDGPKLRTGPVKPELSVKGKKMHAEITDAAMGERAECVMLNKGPHIQEAVRVLDEILRNMQSHQSKKHSMLCRLDVAERLPGQSEDEPAHTSPGDDL